MNILCCFKIVNDFDLIMERDWDAAGDGGVDLSYSKKLINCYDEAGLAAALRIKADAESHGDHASITAVTLGNGSFEGFFKNLFALGVERIIQIKAENLSPFAPKKTAEILFEATKDSRFDLIICGKQSADGANGLVPYLLAKLFSLPCIGSVRELSLENGAITALCDFGEGQCKKTVRAPAVFALGDSTKPYLPLATLKRKLAAANMSAEIIELSKDLQNPNPPPILRREKSQRHCVFIEGETCAEQAKKLLQLHPEVRP
ncbi:MAG: hypothetical protein RSB53_01900 [Oscillospiraceae bacterium]